VQDDGPTMPNLPPYEGYDAPGRAPGGMPVWPEAGAGPRRSFPWRAPSPVLVASLEVSLGINISLIMILVTVFVLARAGYFAPRISSLSTPPASTTNAVASVTSATTSSGGWLQVAPTSVQVGCDGGQQTQFVVLANTGPQDVQWQAVFPASADQAGVEMSRMQGNLRAGTSIALQIHSTSQSVGQQGVIHFEADTPDAGASPSLSYTSAGCS
jgi:hypothetical protein